jgi:long-chain acyl-CoA synthetase
MNDTLPKILRFNYQRYGDKAIAMRRKEFGIWTEYTWKDYYTHVKYFALGLLSLGFRQGDKIAIIGDNDPEWYWAELAALSLRGVAFGIYVDCMPDEIKYYLEHSDARFVVAHDQEQVDKVLQLKDAIPDLKKIIYWEEKGLWNYREEVLASFEEIENMGRDYEKEHPNAFEELLEQGRSDDIAIFCYTSGTTGLPKGAMLSHENIINTVKLWANADNVGEREDYFSYIPPAWVTEQFLGICMGLMKAWIINFPEDPETAQKDLREIGPKRLFYGARLWEGVASFVQAKIAEATPLKRWSYNFALRNAGYPMAKCKRERRRPNPFLRLFYWLMWLIVFRPLQNKLGLTNLQVGYTAGAAIAPQTMELFHAFGINVKNLYGSTEAGVVTIHPDGDIRFETVGKVIEGCNIKISEEGEILVKGPTIFSGYYKNEEETKKKFINGYYRTGDAGYFDKDGHLIYWDRVSEILELSNGSKFSPQFIEVRLRFSPFIRDVMVIGGKDRDFITAIINIDYENVGKWAERNHLSYTTYVDLSQKREVCELIKKEIENVNSSLPEDVRIRRFVNLHKEFDADEAELTRTRKLRRELLEKKYDKLIQSMYEGREAYRVETEVTYQDGRKGRMQAEVFINEL